jgi:hypothetical protein
MGSTSSAQAGWYPDPHNPTTQRYWDGTTWTAHVHDRAAAASGGGPTGYGGPGMAGGGSYYVSVMGQEQGPLSAQQLQQMALAKQLDANTLVRAQQGGWFPASQVPGVFSDKDWTTALILSVLVGALGVDQFYLGNTGLGLGKLFTLGGCGVWSLIDIIRIATNSVTDSEGRPLRK